MIKKTQTYNVNVVVTYHGVLLIFRNEGDALAPNVSETDNTISLYVTPETESITVIPTQRQRP